MNEDGEHGEETPGTTNGMKSYKFGRNERSASVRPIKKRSSNQLIPASLKINQKQKEEMTPKAHLQSTGTL